MPGVTRVQYFTACTFDGYIADENLYILCNPAVATPGLQLITAAEANGHTRLVEMNRQVLGNLDRIITSLTDDEQVPDAG